MTSKERWTVYPLLFLTLGLVMRDRMEAEGRQFSGNQVATQELVTNRIRIVDGDGLTRTILTPDEIVAPKFTAEEIVSGDVATEQLELQALKVVNSEDNLRIVLTANGWQLLDPSKIRKSYAPD